MLKKLGKSLISLNLVPTKKNILTVTHICTSANKSDTATKGEAKN